MIPADSRRTRMRVMRTTEATVIMLLDESLNAKVNMNQTHIDLKILRVVTPQTNQNSVTCHQRENQTTTGLIHVNYYYSLKHIYIIKL